MESGQPTAQLDAILAGLGREICRPLDELHRGLSRLVNEPDNPGSAAEQAQARTMIQLCEDLRRLTEASFGSPPAGEALPGGG